MKILIVIIILIIIVLLTLEHFTINDYSDFINSDRKIKTLNSPVYETNNKNIIDKLYPIGSIYMSNSKSDDPNRIKGTKWELFVRDPVIHVERIWTFEVIDEIEDNNFYLMNDNSKYNTIGGEKTNQMTYEHLPSHSHYYTKYNGTKESMDSNKMAKNEYYENQTISMTNDGGQYMKYYPQYIRFYVWKRIE